MATIKSKSEFYRLWKNLQLGNRIAIFDNIDEFLKSNWSKPTSIRYKVAGSPYVAFYVPADKVLDKVEEFVEKGADKDLFVFNESTPDDCLLIQGEAQYIYENSFGLTLTYNTDKVSMRSAMTNFKMSTGLKAKMILEHYLNAKSYEMLKDLFEEYPNDVIEFGVYSKKLGVLPGHNTVIWEIRNY